MNLDELFEDLETQFEVALDSTNKFQNFGIEKLTCSISGTRLTLEKPLLGKNFIAGIVSGKAIWRFQPHRSLGVARIQFGQEPEPSIENQTATQLLGESLLGRFVRYSLTGDGQQIRRGRVLQLMSSLILFESTSDVLAVSVERLAWLEVHASDN